MHLSEAAWALAQLHTVADILAQVTPTPGPTPGATSDLSLAQGLSPLVMVRALTLGSVAFLLSLIIGKPVINWLRDRRIGKHIRIEGPERHQVKTGTPTMGGIIFLIPLVITIGIFMDILKFRSLLLPLGVVLSCGILGGFDDLLSTVAHNRGGLTARFKMVWLLVIGAIVAWILYFPLGHHGLFIPFIQNPANTKAPFDIGYWYLPIALLMFVGFANAINFTDGLDTLAGGTSAIAFASYGVIAFLQTQEPVVPLCFAVAGALLAFLWYNAHPAMVIMGDAGALTLGGLLMVCAFMTDQWLLLPLIGIVFVAETISIMLQVLYFKLTGGKRLFKMAPIHHHFELLGWSETQITMRFWLVSMLAGMLGIALALI